MEAAKLLLDAWKFRQAHAWSSLTRYFFAAVSVSAIPYILRDELIRRLNYVLLLFPVIAGLLAIAAIWLYAAEYTRAQSMNHAFRNLLEKYGYYKLTDAKEWKLFLSPTIGRATVYILLIATIFLSAANLIIVWRLLNS